MRRILLSFALLSVLSCTSMQEKAEKLLGQGNFDEAASLFEQVLAKKPGNPEATLGLKRAREGMIDRDLIKVRSARLAGDSPGAADTLHQILEHEEQWKIYPSGPVASTQNEELDFGRRFVEARIRLALDAKRPLEVAYITKHFQDFFGTSAEARFRTVRANAEKIGRKNCADFKNLDLEEKPFLRDYFEGYCHLFGKKLPVPLGAKSKSDFLYGKLKVTTASAEIRSVRSSDGTLEDALRSALTKTAWYEPTSKHTIQIQLNGYVNFQESRRMAMRTQAYTVDVPYTAYEETQRTRQMPHMEYEQTYDAISRQYVSKPVTKYKTETYYESVPVTKHRNETRTQDYSVTEIRHLFQFSIEGSAPLFEDTLGFQTSVDVKEDDFEHHHNMPDIDIKPHASKLASGPERIQAAVENLKKIFSERLNEIWIQRNCGGLKASQKFEVAGEEVFRCVAAGKSIPPFANQWFQTHYGLTAIQANEVLGFIH